MSSIGATLARRGFEVVQAHVSNGEDKKIEYNLPTWGVVMLGATVLLFFGILFMIEYTFARVIPTLLVIESPQENIDFEPLPQSDPDSTIKTPELETLKPQPITSSFRKTIKHLQAIGGFRARFRGLSVFLVNAVVVQWIAGIISILPIIRLLPRGLLNLGAAVACAQLTLAWTHIVISEPSPKPWFRRMPSMKLWRKVAVPTALFSVAEQVSVFVPFYIAAASGMKKTHEEMKQLTSHEQTILALKGLGLGALGLLLTILLWIPASVVLTRVQASLLPDTEETIVPFDRSFGGKIVPEIVGGSGAIGIVDAWTTFDRSSWIRLIKAYVKVFAMQFAVSLFFSIVIILELCIVVGKDFSKLHGSPDDSN